MPIEKLTIESRKKTDGEFLDYDDMDTSSSGFVYSLCNKDEITDTNFAFKITPEPLQGDGIQAAQRFCILSVR